MSIIVLEAELRTQMGKGASRRLRHDNKVPAVIYGGGEETTIINLFHNKVLKALENEKIYASVFDITLGKKVEHVILKDIQRHPYKPIIMHMDLQRVSAKDVLVKQIPLHFINEDIAKGVKAGGQISHNLVQVEIRCQAQNLPEFIDVDLSKVMLGETLHLSDLQLPKGALLTVDIKDPNHNLPVVSIHAPKGGVEETSAE